MQLDPQAARLNEAIASAAPPVMDLLSRRGRAIFFPKLGILSQSAEAVGKAINATIGIALEEDGSPMRLPCIARQIDLPPANVFPYAPSPGRPDIRKLWKEMLVRKNPALAGKPFSLPVVTGALTHGLSMCGYLFCDHGDSIILPDLFWENYELVYTYAYGAQLDRFPMFTPAGGFNVAALRTRLLSGAPGKRLVCLNFPNNPCGYTPTVAEVQAIAAALLAAAERGCRIAVLIDDAYFGLVFEPGVYAESIFAALCDLHPNLLAVKLDGPTKEDYVWGFRVGFMTYGIQGGTPALFEALEAKTGGAIRGNVSNISQPGQSLLVKAWSAGEYADEKRGKFELLQRRYAAVKGILAAHPEYREQFAPLPFNSGYFMCLRLLRADPEQLRRKLLDAYSTGVIAMCGVIRIAFSATPTDRLERLFDNIYRACRELAGK